MSTYTCIRCRITITGQKQSPCGSYLSPCRQSEGYHVWIKIGNCVNRMLRKRR